MTLIGSEGIISSCWNWIASRLFAGVLLADAKLNSQDVTLVVDSGAFLRRRKTMWIAIGVGVILLILIGLFIRSGGRIIALGYEDFPRSELEQLRMPEGWAPLAEMTFSGPLQAEAHSRWTWWAMKLFAGTFMVDAQLAGRRITLVVDTGAILTIISPEVAVAAHASLIAEGPEITHWGQPIQTYLGWVQELEIANLRAYSLPVLILGKQPVLRLLGFPVYKLDGLLGMSLMRKLAVALDWRTGTVTLSREPLQVQAPSAPLRLVEGKLHSFSVFNPIVDGFLDGKGPYMMLIDTGTSDAKILVSDELLPALGWKGKVLVQHLQLGEIELKDVLAIPAHEQEATGVKLKGAVILIGNGVFQSQGFRRLTLDFLAGKLYAER
jgi:hypothetical protein